MVCSQLVLLRIGVLPIQILGDLPDEVIDMAIQWTVYVVMLCSFHMGEFFTTALCNPTVVSSDSFMVNHSKAYTTAALVSDSFRTNFSKPILFFDVSQAFW